MKKIALLLSAVLVLILSSCETTREISLQEDGTGMLVTTNDMSNMISMAKMAGNGQDLDKLGNDVIDTTVALTDKLDSLDQISDEEKELIKNGKLGMLVDMKNEKVVTKLHFPFSDPAMISRLDKLSSKIGIGIIRQQMNSSAGNMPPGMTLPEISVDDYFITTYSKGILERKLDKEKYAGVENNEEVQALKQLATLGVGNVKTIFNLPSPVKNATGESLTVSEDKKVVTVMTSIDDFFSDAESLEFRIEY